MREYTYEATEVSVADAAAILGVNRVRAWRIIKQHNLPHRYLSARFVVVDRAALEQFAVTNRERGRPRKEMRRD